MVRFFVVALLLVSLACTTKAASAGEQLPLQPDDTVRTTDGWGWEDCGVPGGPVQIDSITVSPDPPQPGKDLTVKVSGKVKQLIEEGAYADVVVSLGRVKLLHKEFDLCQEARNANATVQCPVNEGDYDVTQTVALPKEIPRAKFRVDVRGYDADDEELFCLKLSVDFMKRPFFQMLGF